MDSLSLHDAQLCRAEKHLLFEEIFRQYHLVPFLLNIHSVLFAVFLFLFILFVFLVKSFCPIKNPQTKAKRESLTDSITLSQKLTNDNVVVESESAQGKREWNKSTRELRNILKQAQKHKLEDFTPEIDSDLPPKIIWKKINRVERRITKE